MGSGDVAMTVGETGAGKGFNVTADRPKFVVVRVYSSDAFGIDGLNHAFVYAPGIGKGRGMDGTYWWNSGDGVKSLDSPYTEVNLPPGMTEEEFMKAINQYLGWETGIWCPWWNDCHSQLEEAFNQAGVKYPGAPNGRLDIDDMLNKLWDDFAREFNNPYNW